MKSTRFIVWVIVTGIVLQMSPSMKAVARQRRSARPRKEVDRLRCRKRVEGRQEFVDAQRIRRFRT